MPVPFHTALRDDLRPLQPDNERALLEQRARMALAEERRQRRHHADDGKRRSRSGTERTSAALRAGCVIGLVLVALCAALASEASALPGSRPQATGILSGAMRSGGGQVVAMTATTGSGHHYTGHQVSQGAAIQPRALPGSVKNASPGSAFHYTGREFRRRAAVQPSLFSTRSGATFHWADAGVGAGVTAVLGLLGVTGALSRRRVRGQMTA